MALHISLVNCNTEPEDCCRNCEEFLPLYELRKHDGKCSGNLERVMEPKEKRSKK